VINNNKENFNQQMKFKQILFSIYACCYFIVGNAQIQDSILTLKKAVELGVVNSKVLKASTEKINIAIAKVNQAKSQNLPSAKLSSTYTRISDNITPFSVKFPNAPTEIVLNPQILNQFGENISVSQLIYSGGRVKKTVTGLEFLKAASELDFKNDRDAVVYNIISAYYSLYKLQEANLILKENEKLIKARLTDLQNLEKNGLLLRNDVLKLELSLSQINIQQLDNSNSFQTTKYGLNILIGLPDTANYHLDTTGFFTYKLTQPYAAYEQLATTTRFDVDAASKRLEASKLNIDVTKSNYYPMLISSAGYNYLRPSQRVFPQKDQFNGTWTAGISLAWDISSLYNNKHYIAEAKSTFNQYAQQKASLSDNIKVELYSNYLAYQKAVEHLKLSEQTLNQANENYRLIEDRLKNNLVIITDLQDALNYLLQSQINVLIDKAEIDLAYFKFIKSVGLLNN